MTPRSAAGKAGLGAALIVAVLPLVMTWGAVIGDASTLALAAAVALAVLATGIGFRVLRLPELTATMAEVVMLAVALGLLSWSLGGWWSFPSLVDQGVRDLAAGTAPVAPTAGTVVVLCLIVGVLALFADWLAVGLDRPILALLPLLTLLLVPALAPKVHRAPTLGLAFFALGVAAILLASRDGVRGVRAARAGVGAVAVAAGTTAVALVAALAVAPLVPIPPSTRGADGEPLQMTDVSLELKRDISQGADSPALDYTTDGGAGTYLRLYSLPTFNSDGWRLVNSTVQMGRLAAPPGLDRGTPRRTSVTITGLKSEWLPAPYAPTDTSAGDHWGYLPDSLAILALGVTDRSSATSSLQYTVDSLDARPSPEQVAAAAAGSPPDGDVTASVPSDIAPTLVRIAHQITDSSPTAGAKAQAILRYLAGPGFTYSLDAQPGSGYQGLEDFLLRDRRGFCVQYAASMAILARIVGIPSRVAVGFTPGRRVGDNWTVTMHDMHAWPELYLAGWGWVSFEPTPGVGGSDGAPAAAPATATPSPTATTPTPDAAPPSVAPQSTDGTAAAADDPWPPVLAVLAVLVAAALAVTPSWLRRRRRAARLGGGRDPSSAALSAWAEVRATAQDWGRPWTAGSPRFAAAEAASWVDAEAGAGVIDLGLAVERTLYGGSGHAPGARDWAPVASAFASALAERTPSRARRWRARWFPPSLLGLTGLWG